MKEERHIDDQPYPLLHSPWRPDVAEGDAAGAPSSPPSRGGDQRVEVDIWKALRDHVERTVGEVTRSTSVDEAQLELEQTT